MGGDKSPCILCEICGIQWQYPDRSSHWNCKIRTKILK